MIPDPLFERLARLPVADPTPEFSAKLRAAACARLCARPVHPAWAWLVATWVAGYLGWAVHVSSSLYRLDPTTHGDRERRIGANATSGGGSHGDSVVDYGTP
ncbi:MAG: hypothetical protein ABSF69_27235 [Polyangiaceae bacterium]|jgi:hypothetical protein